MLKMGSIFKSSIISGIIALALIFGSCGKKGGDTKTDNKNLDSNSVGNFAAKKPYNIFKPQIIKVV